MSRAEHTASASPDRRDPVRHQGRPAPRRASEHGPGLERRRPAALLPDQPARRPALPAGRPAALPGRRGDGRCRTRHRTRVSARASPADAWPATASRAGRCRSRRLETADPIRSTPSADLALLDAIARVRLPARRPARRISIASPAELRDDLRSSTWSRSGSSTASDSYRMPVAVPTRRSSAATLELPAGSGSSARRSTVATSRARRGPAEAPGASAVVAGGSDRVTTRGPARRPAGAGGRDPGSRRTVGRAARRRRGRGDRSDPRDRDVATVVADALGAIVGVRPAGRGGRATCSIGPRRSAGSPATSAAGSTSTGSWPAWSTTRWSCSRATAPRSSSSRADGTRRRRGQPRPVGRVPLERPRLPGAVAAGRRGRRAPAAVRGRLPRRPARRGRPRRGRPGGLRHALHGAAARRHRAARAAQRLPRPAAPLDAPTSSTRSAALATQASVAIRAAQDFERMATWAAQLQSIQQLGARLNRLSSVARDRAWRSRPSCASSSTTTTSASTGSTASDLIPVAMQGQVGEYVDETPDQLRVAVGEGITGWVAEHRDRPDTCGDAAERPAGRHDPGHRGRPRRVDAPRADDLRGPGPRRPRPLEARPQPVHATTTCACS